MWVKALYLLFFLLLLWALASFFGYFKYLDPLEEALIHTGKTFSKYSKKNKELRIDCFYLQEDVIKCKKYKQCVVDGINVDDELLFGYDGKRVFPIGITESSSDALPDEVKRKSQEKSILHCD